MQNNICILSKKGKKQKNDDSYFVGEINGLMVLAVADGLGGHGGGDIASKIAIGELKEAIARHGKKGIKKAFEQANRSIFLQNEEKGIKMATTMVVCVLEEYDCIIANVGDSRAYLFMEDNIWRTKDHSLVQELIDGGIIGDEEAFYHSQKNVVTQALGIENKIKIDIYEKNVTSSILLLCSDGLSDYVRDEEIAEIVKKYEVKKICKKLYKKAIKNGSVDDITIICADMEE